MVDKWLAEHPAITAEEREEMTARLPKAKCFKQGRSC
jgi:hypothetical protein